MNEINKGIIFNKTSEKYITFGKSQDSILCPHTPTFIIRNHSMGKCR